MRFIENIVLLSLDVPDSQESSFKVLTFIGGILIFDFISSLIAEI